MSTQVRLHLEWDMESTDDLISFDVKLVFRCLQGRWKIQSKTHTSVGELQAWSYVGKVSKGQKKKKEKREIPECWWYVTPYIEYCYTKVIKQSWCGSQRIGTSTRFLFEKYCRRGCDRHNKFSNSLKCGHQGYIRRKNKKRRTYNSMWMRTSTKEMPVYKFFASGAIVASNNYFPSPNSLTHRYHPRYEPSVFWDPEISERKRLPDATPYRRNK